MYRVLWPPFAIIISYSVISLSVMHIYFSFPLFAFLTSLLPLVSYLPHALAFICCPYFLPVVACRSSVFLRFNLISFSRTVVHSVIYPRFLSFVRRCSVCYHRLFLSSAFCLSSTYSDFLSSYYSPLRYLSSFLVLRSMLFPLLSSSFSQFYILFVLDLF